ncbi:MAG: hypothetical protein ACE5D6_09710 [Candidatus Zixiibacteriota bacterium]
MKSIITIITVVFFIAPTPSRAVCDCSHQGDVDGSGGIDIADIVYFVEYSFKSGPAPVSDNTCPSPNRADLDCNNTVDIADLVAFVDYSFSNGFPPCDFCLYSEVPEGDPTINPDYLIFLDTNFYNMYFDSGSSAFVCFNNPGANYESITYMQGDTTVTDDRGFLSIDSANILQYIPGPPPFKQAGILNSTQFSNYVVQSDFSRGHTVKIPGTYCRQDGQQISNSSVMVRGNVVSFNGFNHDFSEEFGLDLTVAERVSYILNNPPPPLTVSQINLACSEDAINVANTRLLYILETKTQSWWSGEDHYVSTKVYKFSFHHYYEWECWDGPMKERTFSEFSVSINYSKNGNSYYNYSTSALHLYTYP